MNFYRYLLAAALSVLNFLPQAYAAPPAAATMIGRTEHGATVDLADYKGKVVLVFFWSTECAVCLDLLPEIRTNLKGWQGKDFVIFAINQDRSMADLNAYEHVLDLVAPPNSQMKIVWRNDPSYHDTFGNLPTKGPTTVVVDRNGMVVKSVTGRAAPEVWDDIAELVLNCATCQ